MFKKAFKVKCGISKLALLDTQIKGISQNVVPFPMYGVKKTNPMDPRLSGYSSTLPNYANILQ